LRFVFGEFVVLSLMQLNFKIQLLI